MDPNKNCKLSGLCAVRSAAAGEITLYLGKGTPLIGKVSIFVLYGFLTQSEREPLIRNPATENPMRTTETQNIFWSFCLLVEILIRPWIVELSRNSFNDSSFTFNDQQTFDLENDRFRKKACRYQYQS